MVNQQANQPYGSVLAPVDMSTASAHALKTADALGLFETVRVTVAHAFIAAGQGKMFVADIARERILEYVDEEKRQAETEVGAFLSANGFFDRGWQRYVREGLAREVILSAIETMRPDLVIVGTHGRSNVARLFLGSVTESLLRAAETDILAVPPAP
jgi:nucleotide-binding universal stress UspA family protein